VSSLSHRTRFVTGALLLLVAPFMLTGCEHGGGKHATFAEPDEAVAALVKAARDSDTAALQRLFGPGAEGIVSSGDPVADANGRARFLAKYDEKHALEPEGDDKIVLSIGGDDWPLPVPLVRRDGRWMFDGAAGVDEVVFRRVGANELGAIAVCRGFVDAQLDYASADRDGEGAGIYAQKLISDPGLHNGLYWETANGEPPSPIGPGVAAAAAEGYRAGSGAPYHGYYYRPLFRQGEQANGGAREYFDHGVLVHGFALLAWPAEYGVSGVMTFMVNQDGVVFQKDLGDDTAAVAAAIEAFDPDPTWIALTPEDDAGPAT
jgi:hypothetical protein